MAEPATARQLPLFFFGTLLDGDVLARVLARPVAPDELAHALLPKHRRHAVVGCVYPVLRPASAGHVEGALFRPRDDDDRRRIDHFEAEEYEARPRRVLLSGKLVNALVYVDYAGVFEVLAKDWSLLAWQSQHKAAYLEACDAWMADYEPVPLSAPAAASPSWPRRVVRAAKVG